MGHDRAADRRRCAVIVNDDTKIGQALLESLAPELDVHCVSSLAQASVLLGRLQWVDLAFVDLELRDGSGDELLASLGRWPDAIRILLSASSKAHSNGLKDRHLAHMLMGKPPAPSIVRALKAAVLGLPRG